MATQTTVTMVDDLDGTPDATTVLFALEGREYKIDLGDDNRQRLRDLLAPFIAAANTARRTKKTGLRSVPTTRTVRDREQTAAIRKWGRAHGWDVADRGRIPYDLEKEYEEAHKDRAS